MDLSAQPGSLRERTYWLIRLRWIAVAGVTSAVFFAREVLGFHLPPFPLYGLCLILAGYNLFFLIYVKKLSKQREEAFARAGVYIANGQIALDLLCLVTLIHFSGGVENPFIFYFIFHVIIASILLSKRAAYLQATLAVFLFCSLVFLELRGSLPHYSLGKFLEHDLYNRPLYILGISFVFISTLYIAVYMATSISLHLRDRERRLKETNLLLEEKDRAKSEYVLRVSHDVKEHLAAIQSCIEPVIQGFVGKLSAKQEDLLRRADQRTEKLLAFVKALLEISRLKLSQHIKKELFSLKEVLENAFFDIKEPAQIKQVTLEIDISSPLGYIWGVRTYIEETLINLLANSVKYTPAGGKITLKAFNQGESFLISIRDTGIGIPSEELPKIFDEFYRARNARETERTGSGLGLAIAQQVMAKHNGKIWAESEENQGSTFYILLPKAN